MRTKDDSVRLDRLRNPLRSRLGDIERAVWPILGYEPVITSAADGKHSYKSAHYRGDAVDLRTWTDARSGDQVSDGVKKQLVMEIKMTLGPGYDVVPEPTHIHVEHDPKTTIDMEATLS